jgi:hypothetical protein
MLHCAVDSDAINIQKRKKYPSLVVCFSVSSSQGAGWLSFFEKNWDTFSIIDVINTNLINY